MTKTLSVSVAGDAAATGYERSCEDAGGIDHGRAIRDVLDRIGDKWSLLVVATLRSERLRFTELQRHIPGISQRMLTLTLRHLERDGLVRREVYPVVPPKVEYELPPLGHTLLRPVLELVAWSLENADEIDRNRATYDASRS